jgi:tetratricopeptide (TPR) repeat protein
MRARAIDACFRKCDFGKMVRISNRAVLLGLTLLLALAASAAGKKKDANSEAKETARVAYQRATKHYNLGEYQEALVDFKDAYRAYEEPTFLFNIAQCQRQLGAKLDAIRSYRAFLRESPSVQNRAEVEQLVASLETALREEQQSKSRPPQGTIGPDRLPDDGTSETASAPAARPPATTAATAPESRPETAAAPALTVTATAPAPTAPTPVYKKWWLWTIVGVAAVGLGVGLGLALASPSVSYPAAQTNAGVIHF